MRTIGIATGALAIMLGACSDYDNENTAYDNAGDAAGYNDTEATGNYDANGTATAASAWPEGSRIVVENGVTYRIDPGGARVTLGPADSRIVVENGVRYRVDPGGARVRINDEGAVIDVDDDGISANVNLGDNTSVQVNSN